jgi:uncharacterized protein
MEIRDILMNTPVITTALTAVAAGVGVYLYAAKVEARSFRLEHLNGINVGTAGGARRLKILHLSDLHLCAPEKQKLEFLAQLPCHQYDLVVLTGDIFENESGLQYALQIVSSKPKLGSYAVLGNHDYYAYTWWNKTYGQIDRKYRHPAQKRDVQPFIDALHSGGITTLRNEAVTLPEANLHLVGIDYPGTTETVVRELSAQAPPESLIIALMHLPRRLQQLVNSGVHMAFAGHTHGGQIRVPGFGALITDSELPRHEASGLVRRGDTLIHVSRGLSADPKTNFRLFCPPAATVLELLY